METPLGVFPDYKIFGEQPLQPSDNFNTEILAAPSGCEQRILWQDNLRRWAATVRPLTPAERKDVRAFQNSHQGRYRSFYFWVPLPEDLDDYAVGSVAGAMSLTLPDVKGPWWLNDDGPIVTATYSNVTVDDVAVIFTASANIGTYGQDRINFTAPQTGLVKVTVSNARLLVVARSDSDSLQQSLMLGLAVVRVTQGIVIKELIP